MTSWLSRGHDVVARTYLEVADGIDPDDLATALNADLLAQGAEARTFATPLRTAWAG